MLDFTSINRGCAVIDKHRWFMWNRHRWQNRRWYTCEHRWFYVDSSMYHRRTLMFHWWCPSKMGAFRLRFIDEPLVVSAATIDKLPAIHP